MVGGKHNHPAGGRAARTRPAFRFRRVGPHRAAAVRRFREGRTAVVEPAMPRVATRRPRAARTPPVELQGTPARKPAAVAWPANPPNPAEDRLACSRWRPPCSSGGVARARSRTERPVARHRRLRISDRTGHLTSDTLKQNSHFGTNDVWGNRGTSTAADVIKTARRRPAGAHGAGAPHHPNLVDNCCCRIPAIRWWSAAFGCQSQPVGMLPSDPMFCTPKSKVRSF
jgi:hypothetical protein